MSQIPVTISGNLTADPEFKSFSTGSTLTKLRIASSRRARVRVTKPAPATEPSTAYDSLDNPNGGSSSAAKKYVEEFQWTDVDNLFIDAECWGDLAVNVYASLKKGMPVVATGYLVTDTWEVAADNADNTVSSDDVGDPENVGIGEAKTLTRSKIKLRADQISFEMGRFQLASRKISNAGHTPNGMVQPQVRTAEDLTALSGNGLAAPTADTSLDSAADNYIANAEAGSDQLVEQV